MTSKAVSERASRAAAGDGDARADRSLRALFFSFRGRIPRGAFLLGSLLLGLAFVLLFLLLDRVASHGATLLLYLPFFWALAALLAKRLHDRGKSPLWLLILLVPLFGPLWIALELCAFPGTAAENRYGADPLYSQVDYKVVT
jgi:uncharacterized membrane protein YhaH (DUF805 family)